MKKRVGGVLFILFFLVFTFAGSKMYSLKAETLSNEITVVEDTSLNQVLMPGDTYTIQLSVSDENIDMPSSAMIYESLRYYNGGRGDIVTFDTSSVVHDEENSCYVIKADITVEDEEPGVYCIYGVSLRYEDGTYKDISLDLNDTDQQRHYVISSASDVEFALNSQQREMTVGETFQLEAYILPNMENAEVEWFSENESLATVDQNGKVTAIKSGTAKIYAVYQGHEYLFQVFVSDVNGNVDSTDKQLFEDLTVVENSAADQTLVVGDTLHIVMQVSDEAIDDADFARFIELNNDSNGEWYYATKHSTSIAHDEENHCYVITFDKTLDESDIGEHVIEEVYIKNDNEQYNLFNSLDANGYINYSVVAADAAQSEETTTSDSNNETANTSEDETTDLSDTTTNVSDDTSAVVAEETDSSTEEVTDSTDDTDSAEVTTDNPQTGDTTLFILLGCAIVISGVMFVVVSKRRKVCHK